jgi:hypothetical protein
MHESSPAWCSKNGYDAGAHPASADKEQFSDIFHGKKKVFPKHSLEYWALSNKLENSEFYAAF